MLIALYGSNRGVNSWVYMYARNKICIKEFWGTCTPLMLFGLMQMRIKLTGLWFLNLGKIMTTYLKQCYGCIIFSPVRKDPGKYAIYCRKHCWEAWRLHTSTEYILQVHHVMWLHGSNESTESSPFQIQSSTIFPTHHNGEAPRNVC